MVKIPDFNRAFQDGATMGNNTVIERRVVGELDLPTGRLVAADAAFAEENPFNLALSPGRYPVILSVALMKNDQRVACAMLQAQDGNPVVWKPALREEDKAEDRSGYGVDSATGCFMDEQTALIWRERTDDDGFFETVMQQMSDGHSEVCCWGNVDLDTQAGHVNAVMFSTGYGDGFYRSYWGYTVRGDIACLVTDFGVLEPSVEL